MQDMFIQICLSIASIAAALVKRHCLQLRADADLSEPFIPDLQFCLFLQFSADVMMAVSWKDRYSSDMNA